MTRLISEMTRAELVGEVVRLQQRNADLAAHLERHGDLLHRLVAAMRAYEMEVAMAEWKKTKPTTSLSRLKAEWQAEAVSEFAFQHLGGHEQELAEIYASKLRRQAEEAAKAGRKG